MIPILRFNYREQAILILPGKTVIKERQKLIKELSVNHLTSDFNQLTEARQNETLKYLNTIKTESTLRKNIDQHIDQLERKEKNVRIA